MHQRFKYGRTTSREQILEVRDGTKVVYTVIGGIPVKNYRAVIELTDNAVGTHVSWTADWGRNVARQARPPETASGVHRNHGVPRAGRRRDGVRLT